MTSQYGPDLLAGAQVGTTTDPRGALVAAAQDHVAWLDAQGLLGPEHGLPVALVLHLARSCAYAKPYSLANLSKELREALALLPTEQAGDAWAQLRDLLGDPAPDAPAAVDAAPAVS